MNNEPQNIFVSAGGPANYWLTRFVILRLLGLVYAIAFMVAINQVIPLIGQNGLLPIGLYLDQVAAALGSAGAGFARLPSIFWLWHSDTALLTIAWIGFALSCVVVAGYANAPMLAILGSSTCPLFMSGRTGTAMAGRYNLPKLDF